jgi:hypothetical protein
MKTKIILSSIVYFGISVLVVNACCKMKFFDATSPDCPNPNPTFGSFSVQLNKQNFIKADLVKLNMYNPLGALVHQTNLHSNASNIPEINWRNLLGGGCFR